VNQDTLSDISIIQVNLDRIDYPYDRPREALKRLTKRIEELEANQESLVKQKREAQHINYTGQSDRIDELEKALKPFVKAYEGEYMGDEHPSDYTQAYKVLRGKE